MPDPTKYEPGFDFSDFQGDNPTSPLPGVNVGIELANISLAIGEGVDAIKDIRRADGALQNGIVTLDALSNEIDLSTGAVPAAEAARDAAIEAQGGAEAARDTTEAARDVAVGASAAAVVAQGAAEAARSGAEQAETNAEGVLASAVRVDQAQAFSSAQQAQGRSNLDVAAQALLPLRGHLHGLALSNNAEDPVNDINIAVGECASGVAELMVLESALTKRLDATWAAGSGNGGRDTGSIGNGTWHVFTIKNPTTGAVDALFSSSSVSPTLPEGFEFFRRIGSILREDGAIVPFYQQGDVFQRRPVLDQSATSQAIGANNTIALSVPAGLAFLQAMIGLRLERDSSTMTFAFQHPAQLVPSTPPYTPTGPVHTRINAANPNEYKTFVVPVNGSRQVRRLSSSTDGTSFSGHSLYEVWTWGWVDVRGKW